MSESSLKVWPFLKGGEGVTSVNRALRQESKLERKGPHWRDTFVNQHHNDI